MKYIRTKDKIYSGVGTATFFMLDKGGYIENADIIAKANTIEELCDEFVVAYEDGARIVYGDLEWAKVKAKASLKLGNESIIYGAIWTDKGLVYVAKMNDKGELELL